MHLTTLRKVGGSVMMAVPPAVLDMLHVSAGATVGLTVSNGTLVVQPNPAPRYTLDGLLAQCDPEAARSAQDEEWLATPSAGREL